MSLREQANREAARRMCEADPVLVDVRSAGEVVPGMTPATVLTSGAPMEWDEYTGGQRRAVHENLDYIRDVIAPVIGEAVRALGELPLKPLMRRAVHMGDELHSRNTAATLLFTRGLTPAFLQLPESRRADVQEVMSWLEQS